MCGIVAMGKGGGCRSSSSVQIGSNGDLSNRAGASGKFNVRFVVIQGGIGLTVVGFRRWE